VGVYETELFVRRAPPIRIECVYLDRRTIFVQPNRTRKAPLSRSPNTHRSVLHVLSWPKYWATTQCLDLFGCA
jgi:hypothetical protein